MEIAHALLDGQDPHDAALLLLQKLYKKPLPEIRRTERGKPYFADAPLHFSISHTKKHVFCVLSDRPVGIDAEEMDRDIRLSLSEKILSPGELQQFRKSHDPRQALLRFWVLKEAAAKCSGEGLQGYPNHTDFSLNDPRIREIDGCFVAIIESEQ